MSYSVAELLDLFRIEVDDLDSSDPLWSEPEIYRYMDRAQKRFAEKTDCFADTATTPITADEPFVAINSRFTKIRSAKLNSSGRKLHIYNFSDIESDGYTDDYGSNVFSLNWEATTGTPSALVLDMKANNGRLVGIPTESDTLNLVVYRLPLTDIENDGSDIELTDTEHQLALLSWMQYLAYSKQDADTYNGRIAASMRDTFYDYTEQARLRYQRLRRKPGTVRYAGL